MLREGTAVWEMSAEDPAVEGPAEARRLSCPRCNALRNGAGTRGGAAGGVTAHTARESPFPAFRLNESEWRERLHGAGAAGLGGGAG